jgi:hypothetical protein
MKNPLVILIVAASLILYLLGVALALATPAPPAMGLTAEDVVRTDDSTIRRVRDGSNGVVCYVVQSYAYAVAPHGRTVAISCLSEHK